MITSIKLDTCLRCGQTKVYPARVCHECAEKSRLFYRHVLFDIYEMPVNKTKAASLIHKMAATALREAGVL